MSLFPSTRFQNEQSVKRIWIAARTLHFSLTHSLRLLQFFVQFKAICASSPLPQTHTAESTHSDNLKIYQVIVNCRILRTIDSTQAHCPLWHKAPGKQTQIYIYLYINCTQTYMFEHQFFWYFSGLDKQQKNCRRRICSTHTLQCYYMNSIFMNIKCHCDFCCCHHVVPPNEHTHTQRGNASLFTVSHIDVNVYWYFSSFK